MNKDITIVVQSELALNGFINRAINLGVQYYFVKPVDANLLKKRVDEIIKLKNGGVLDATRPVVENTNVKKVIDEKISNIFLTVGIPANVKGYKFLREAIKLAVDDPNIINSITKQLYPSVAKVFGTTSSKVERAIRHAIEVAWNRGKIENINNVFGVKVYNPNEKPTNGEFIALVADKMMMEQI